MALIQVYVDHLSIDKCLKRRYNLNLNSYKLSIAMQAGQQITDTEIRKNNE